MWGSDFLLRMQLFGKFGILGGSYRESVGKSHRHTVNHLWSIRLRNLWTGRVDGACIMPLILPVTQLPKFDGVSFNGLPSEYNTFRCVVRCQESVLSFKEFHCLLLAEEIMIESSGRACYGGLDDMAALADAVMPSAT